MSDTQNVKLGVCRVFFDGNDLGYTKGGVEVEVSSDTTPVTVDQFGETEINEYLLKRSLKVKCPLAETTVENVVNVMPGATLVDNATKQISAVAVSATPDASSDYTITLDGVDYTYISDADPTQAEVVAGLVALINADPMSPAVAVDNSPTVELTAKVSGRAFTLAVTGPVGDLTPSTPTPAAAGAKRVDVTHGVGTDLLAIAKELILHPMRLPVSDKSEDFVVPLAATAGALNFAYKLDEERVFNVEFTGYPNATTGVLFKYGDPAAV